MRHALSATVATLALVLRSALESRAAAVTKEQSSSLWQNDDGREEKHHLRGFFTSGSHECSYMAFKRWGDFEHACEWDYGWQGFDLFFRRTDGTFVFECKCEESILGSYSANMKTDRWVLLAESTSQTKCYSKSGKSFGDVVPLFGDVTCAKKPGDKYQRASCDTRTNSCNALTGTNLPEIFDRSDGRQ